MSKNLTQLARRKGVKNTLFQKLVFNKLDAIGHDSADNKALYIEQRRALAKEFLVGEAVVYGSASFYDFIETGDGVNKNAGKQAYVCNGSACLCAGTQPKVADKLKQAYGEENIGHVTCLGRCAENAAFQLVDNKIKHNFSGDDIEHLSTLKNQPSTSSLEHYHVACTLEEPILTAEIEDINQYYHLFNQLADKKTPDDLLKALTESGLRGRGGAGFPTGFKWQSCREALGDEKYIVCNADEGDAGAYSDRYLLEHRPHAVLFGMLMAGYIVGADTGVLYIRDEYPVAISATEQAIQEFNAVAKAFADIFSFTFKIIRGAGAYICGEETALLRSIEGQRPVVSVRPPFPTISGLFGCPTVLNNVETFASIHWIFSGESKTGESLTNSLRYKALGNGKSTGSKLISLDSCFNQPGIYEVAMGTPLPDVFALAGGFSKPLKALQIGGPLGGIIPLSAIEKLTVDFESFAQAGFLLGHASVIGIGTEIKMIDYIQHLFEFTAMESCGKCYPCQLGSVRGQEMVEQAISGEKALDKTLLNDLLETMQLGSLCALGGGVPLPILNILQYFGDEISAYCAEQVAPITKDNSHD